MNYQPRQFLILCTLLLCVGLPIASGQTTGTKVPYQQTLVPADRIKSSPAQLAYRLASSTQSYLSADHALVQFNSTIVTSGTVTQSVTLTNATGAITFTGGAAAILSSTHTFKFFDSSNTGGLTVSLDGSNNPTLSSSGGTLTFQSRLVSSNSIFVSNSTGRLQYSGDALITSTTKLFRLSDDANFAIITMTVDTAFNGLLTTNGGNFTYQYGDFIISTATSPRNSLLIQDTTPTSSFFTQCWSDTAGVCSIGWNWRYTGAGSPEFTRPNGAKSGYIMQVTQNGATDTFGLYYVTGNTNADIHPAMTLDTTASTLALTISIPWTGAYNWRQTFTTGSGSVTVPSWVSRVFITVVGAGGGGVAGSSGGGGGGCILNMPVVAIPAFATTMSYAVGVAVGAGSGSTGGSSSITYNGFVYQATGGTGGVGTTGGTGGNAIVFGQTLASGSGGIAGNQGIDGGRADPFFFGGGGGGATTFRGGASGYMQANGGGSSVGTGGSSCLGVGANSGAVSGRGGGGSSTQASGTGYVEFYGIGGI